MTRDQEHGYKRLNESVLHPGDIVLATATAVTSKTIRVATGSDVSHAMLYAEDHSVIDATNEGVHSRNTQRLHFDNDCSVYVLRLRAGITRQQLDGVLTFARSHIGTQYSVREAIQTVVGRRDKWSTKQFCSRLVAQAFSSAGIELVDNANFCSPADLQRSKLLEEIPNATVPVGEGEAESWSTRADIPQLMRDATNALLDGARKSDPSIQSLNDLDLYLAWHPEKDAEFSGLLSSSGYLTLWQIEKEKNPWQYDLKVMRQEPTDGLESYCRSLLQGEAVAPNRYVVNRGGYRRLVADYGLTYYKLMLELYERLAFLHHQRVDVATEWLQAQGHLEVQADVHLIPHSAEWFDALEVWDPIQAAMTRAAIETFESADICSVCGDEPAQDYYLPKPFRPGGGVDSLRLCEDCLGIRRASGEPFVSLA
ncbi:MAG: hypothetical protein BGO25_03720 [Acidobacteriales bacterium 59-55]|nr:MAG: hypothetical protein BGO25_03720 [Acidobacteriales bacterium 59-55]